MNPEAGGFEEEFAALLEEANRLLDQGEYLAALAEAKRAVGAALPADDPAAKGVLGAFRIDVGSRAERIDIVRMGIEDLESLAETVDDTRFDYNIGNGYLALGGKEDGGAPGTRPSLQKAVFHFERALQKEPGLKLRTNLATALQYQGRYIEALDEYDRIIEENPEHAIALAQRGRCLWLVEQWFKNHGGLLIGSLNDHLLAIKCTKGAVPESYREAVRMLEERGIKPHFPKKVTGTKTQEWILRNQLGLDPCPICKAESPGAFDVFPLSGPVRVKRPGVSHNALVEIFNALCRTYGTARWCLMRGVGAVELPPGEDIVLIPTRLNSSVSVPVGLVLTAASQFFTVFQQASFALNQLFGLGHPPTEVDFWRVWAPPKPEKGKRKAAPLDRSELHPKLADTPNSALNALFYLACSFDDQTGRYGSLRGLRNKLAHRVVVVGSEDRDTDDYTVMSTETIEQGALALARLSKAAIWYLAGIVRHEEDEAARSSTQKIVVTDGPGVERV